MNPFLVLDVPSNVSDDGVRAAYQTLLRRYPPERSPEQFQQIQEAYQTLRTARERWSWRLLHLESDSEGPLDAMEKFVRLPGRMRPPGASALRGLVRSCAAAAMREASVVQQAACRPPKR